ncbi:hypothetical protein [Enhygromyxa salina]|uniref:Uncharacterized protein n=1 Tax=Enhygromyxa salina TaxID=215803 RepID=A0A2S9YMI8_9BACT|nr:hypothetical protein [Enhygromyxa salina]PRQ06302.1 hypothetical protein ENSA7_39790 [Enhygromyxa salina]
MRRQATLARLTTTAITLTIMIAPQVGCGDDVSEGGSEDTIAGPGLRGRLIDAAEQPMPNVQVLACQATSCAYGQSGPDGYFEFEIEPPAQVALKTHTDLGQSPRMAAALEPVDIVDQALVDIGTVYVPELPEGAIIEFAGSAPQTLAAGDGLELTLRRDDITPPIGEFLYDVAARRLPPQHVPSYPELDAEWDAETLVAVYAMHPFAATSASPIELRAPVDLPNGTAVSFRTISSLDGSFSDSVPGHVLDGYATTDPGAGITRLTYLVICAL